MEVFLPVTAIVISSTLALIFLVLYLKERGSGHENLHIDLKDLDPGGQKNYQLLNEAIKKSQEMLSASESESLKMIANSKTNIQKLEEEHTKELEGYIKQFEESIKNTSAQVSQSINLASSQFNTFLQQLAEKSQQFEAANEQATTVRIEKMLDQLETKLSDFLLESEQKTTGAIDLELQSTRQLIETYKQQQLKLIDENIISMMERTMALVIGKRLTLKDQLDLVYESLEKAKLEKFII